LQQFSNSVAIARQKIGASESYRWDDLAVVKQAQSNRPRVSESQSSLTGWREALQQLVGRLSAEVSCESFSQPSLSWFPCLWRWRRHFQRMMRRLSPRCPLSSRLFP